jgi:hypothetical protein
MTLRVFVIDALKKAMSGRSQSAVCSATTVDAGIRDR